MVTSSVLNVPYFGPNLTLKLVKIETRFEA